MEQLARGSGTSQFTRLRVVLVLLPATVAGTLFGHVAYLRAVRRPPPKALI